MTTTDSQPDPATRGSDLPAEGPAGPAPPRLVRRPPPRHRVARWVYRYGLIAVLAGLLVYFSVDLPTFATYRNLLIILESVAIVAVIGLGDTVSLVVGGFDLSVGANASLVVMVAAMAMVRFDLLGGWAIVAALVAGLVVGAANAALIVGAGIPDLVATLATMFLFDGLALMITSGQSISVGAIIGGHQTHGSFTHFYLQLGIGKIASVPVPVVIMLVLTALVAVFLERTRWGRAMYAIGGNPEAARLAGIPVNRYRVLAYLLAGELAAAGGILLSAQLGRGDVGAGDTYLLQAVAAALIGFAVLGLNRPNAIGTVVGAIFIGVLINGLTQLNFPYYTQDFVQGAVLVVALLMSYTIAPDRRRR